MNKFACIMLSLSILLVALLVSACAGSPTPTPTPTATTMGQYAQAGTTVFANRCAKCHGDKGQGVTAPAVIGQNASLDKYNTAQGLLNFMSAAMPLDAPGALSQQEYRQLLCFLLVQNNFAAANAPFDQNNLSSIALKK